jgi:2-dehydro-3-deoxygluconokinase
MPDLVQHCDVIMGNLWAAEKMLGIHIIKELVDQKDAYLDQALKTSQEMTTLFTSCKQVANTFRFDEGEGVRYYATLYDAQKLYLSKEHHTEFIVDKVGSGDTFMAGLLYGNHHKLAPQEIIDFASAAAFTKLFIKGDATTVSVEEIKKAI